MGQTPTKRIKSGENIQKQQNIHGGNNLTDRDKIFQDEPEPKISKMAMAEIINIEYVDYRKMEKN